MLMLLAYAEPEGSSSLPWLAQGLSSARMGVALKLKTVFALFSQVVYLRCLSADVPLCPNGCCQQKDKLRPRALRVFGAQGCLLSGLVL